ncbi:MAG TPA: NAD(P)-binding protein, partial [Baekduia sp.]|nr:NAD(P)-binding protein [Baekduia sp.]
TDKPVVGTGRFTDPDRMLEIIDSGQLDFIGAARPGIADPFMPRKIAAGEVGQVRKCIGSNRCAIASAMDGNMACSQNATTGEEHRRGWAPERFTPATNADRPVLIVGAGPAGLECATVLARRGFKDVQIVDAEGEMGGHMRWFSQLPGFGEWGRVVSERKAIVENTPDIKFSGSKRLDADGVLASGAAIVIVATGSHWATQADSFFTNTPIPGADASLDHVLTPEQFIVGGKKIPGKHVVVYDCQADFLALGVVQYLQAQGHEVELASPFADIAMRSHSDGVSHALIGAIGAAGGRLRPSHFMVAVAPTGPVFLDSTMSETPVEADATVLLARRSSDSELYTELLGMADERESAGIEALYRIGDCIAPQDLADAVFSGHRLAREIDAADPALPLPALRV